MISRDVFTQGMGILADRFGRALLPPTQAAYYKQLAVLSDAEFMAAIEIGINETFLPGPAQIVAFVRPAPNHKVHAEQLWSDVLTAIRRTPWRMISRAAFADHEWKVIATVGGLDAIANMTDAAEPHVHRRFLEAYVERAVQLGSETRATVALEAIDSRARVLVERTALSIGDGGGNGN